MKIDDFSYQISQRSQSQTTGKLLYLRFKLHSQHTPAVQSTGCSTSFHLIQSSLRVKTHTLKTLISFSVSFLLLSENLPAKNTQSTISEVSSTNEAINNCVAHGRFIMDCRNFSNFLLWIGFVIESPIIWLVGQHCIEILPLTF
jgi:hypothetical protein